MAFGVEHMVQPSAKLIEVLGNDVDQVNPFRLVPNVFDRLQVGRVRCKPIHIEPCRSLVLQPTHGGAVSWHSVALQGTNRRYRRIAARHSAQGRRPITVVCCLYGVFEDLAKRFSRLVLKEFAIPGDLSKQVIESWNDEHADDGSQ